jgi:hypothetical protein
VLRPISREQNLLMEPISYNLEALKEALQMSDVLVKASLPILTAKTPSYGVLIQL